MAIQKIIALFDRKGEAFGKPTFCNNVAEAERGLYIELLNGEKSEVFIFAEDYEIVEFGTFDNMSGKFELLPTPKFVVSAQSVKNIIEKQRREEERKNYEFASRNAAKIRDSIRKERNDKQASGDGSATALSKRMQHQDNNAESKTGDLPAGIEQGSLFR